MSSLKNLPGIGPATAGAFEALGIDSIEKLAGADPAMLIQVRGITAARAQSLIAAARAHTPAPMTGAADLPADPPVTAKDTGSPPDPDAKQASGKKAKVKAKAKAEKAKAKVKAKEKAKKKEAKAKAKAKKEAKSKSKKKSGKKSK
jgi:hypothetical protein